MPDNHLYYGDNLDILRRYIPTDSVDLIYLDPPFNSKQAYNAFYEERPGVASSAQVEAFEDTWHWEKAAPTFFAVVETGGPVSQALQAFRKLLGDNDMLAYLSMMAARLVELRRVLKSTGSIYLHCDPTASHYLKLLMDAIFGPRNYRSEIVWKRSSAHSDTKQGRAIHGHIHDVILFYAASETWKWNPLYTPYGQEYIDEFYHYVEPGTGRRYRLGDLTAARPGGDTEYEWKGVKPYAGRYWAYSRENMEKYDADGRLVYSKSGMPSYKRYLDEMPGVPLQDLWTDIRPISPRAAERLGYATQKPEALLERILRTSSNEGDLILDPFCGCGTAVSVAQRLHRRWIGIDITHIAITLIRSRLRHAFQDAIIGTYDVTGEPTTLSEAQKLAKDNPWQFQLWALGKVDARPEQVKKGADQGVDGRLFFHIPPNDETHQAVLSVKGGHTGPDHVRDLAGVIGRDNAEIGVLITLEEPSAPMRNEAAGHGMYTSPWGTHPRVQILTIADLLGGKQISMPPPSQVNITFKRAPKATREVSHAQAPLIAEQS